MQRTGFTWFSWNKLSINDGWWLQQWSNEWQRQQWAAWGMELTI